MHADWETGQRRSNRCSYIPPQYAYRLPQYDLSILVGNYRRNGILLWEPLDNLFDNMELCFCGYSFATIGYCLV